MKDEQKHDEGMQRWARRGHFITKAAWVLLAVAILVVLIRHK